MRNTRTATTTHTKSQLDSLQMAGAPPHYRQRDAMKTLLQQQRCYYVDVDTLLMIQGMNLQMLQQLPCQLRLRRQILNRKGASRFDDHQLMDSGTLKIKTDKTERFKCKNRNKEQSFKNHETTAIYHTIRNS